MLVDDGFIVDQRYAVNVVLEKRDAARAGPEDILARTTLRKYF